MGLIDFIKGYKERNRIGSLRRNISKLSNKHQLSENRYAAAESLYNNGSNEAIAGLLKRFNFTYENSIKDKAEKEYVSKLILNFGERAIPFIKNYIKNEANISWPLQILDELIPKNEILNFLLSLLNDEDATFKESVLEKRLDLLNYLSEFKDREIVEKVISFLSDEEEEVRFKAIEVLGKQGDSSAKDHVLKLLADDSESIRIKMKIFEVLLITEWPVSGFRKKVEEILPEGYYLTREGIVKIRGNVLQS